MGDAFLSQPEFFEVELGESLISRTETLATFRELGPPDLCHVIKSANRAGSKDIGSYHYVSGVDASSSAALAAYINSLTYELDQNPAWFSGKGSYKLKSGAYCCFNAFSRVDVRVEVRIPGSVDAYVVDLRGERHETTPEIWQEVYLSALLRSILYADDANYRLAGYRKLDPISTPDAEHRFLQVAENLFFKGWQLGSDPEIQVATVVSNHLTAGILKYFGDSFRYEQAVNLFEKLYAREPEVAALVAQAYVGMNEETKAVQTMYQAIKNNPQSYSLLHVQVDFLRSKGKTEWALKLAKQAVNCAPSEFVTWAKLTECYIELGEWESALFTLNSCPMFTYNERDLHRMPTPARSHLPIKAFIAESALLNEDSARDNEADVALLRLPAPALRGTFSKAYGLLTKLVSKIGWDELLKCRSSVFVMEEEYRAQKANQGGSGGAAEEENWDAATKVGGEAAAAAMVNGSTKADGEAPKAEGTGAAEGSEALGDDGEPKESAMRALSQRLDSLGVNSVGAGSAGQGAGGMDDGASVQSIPTIKISTESDHEREKLELESFEAAEASNGAAATQPENATTNIGSNGHAEAPAIHVEAPPLERPAQAQASVAHARTDSQAQQAAATDPSQNGVPPTETIAGGSAQAAANAGEGGGAATGSRPSDGPAPAQSSNFSFTNKRLCERWLDNLFMVLYEDLRVYTIWRAEVAHYKAQGLAYRKTGSEWEILGELALRLHHKEEAKDAFQRCVDGKFSAKAYLRLLETYAANRDVERSLWTALRLTAYQHRWYMEGSYPSAVATNLFRLIKDVGLSKVSYTLVSMSPPKPILRLMQAYFGYAQIFKLPGHDF